MKNPNGLLGVVGLVAVLAMWFGLGYAADVAFYKPACVEAAARVGLDERYSFRGVPFSRRLNYKSVCQMVSKDGDTEYVDFDPSVPVVAVFIGKIVMSLLAYAAVRWWMGRKANDI